MQDDQTNPEPSDGDGPPNIFGGGASAPAPRRDLRAEILSVVNAAERPLTLLQVQEELKDKGYVAEGPVLATLDALVNDGAIGTVPLGDPLVVHYRRIAAAVDRGLLRAVCVALAAIPDDRKPEASMLSAHEIAQALTARSGGAFDTSAVEPLLDVLLQRGLLETATVKRALPRGPLDGSDGDAEPGGAPPSVAVTVYGFAPGLLHQLLVPGFEALIDPDLAAVTPAPGGGDAATGEAGLAAAKAAAASVYATRIVEAEKAAKAATAGKVAAEKRAAAATALLAQAKKRLEDRGLHGLFDEAIAIPSGSSEPDERGKPIRYEKRVPVTEELRARFHRDGKAIRRKIDSENSRIESAKASLKVVTAEVNENIAVETERQRAMDRADDEGNYLLVVDEAYKLFDPAARRTGVYEWATRRFVCWDDPADLPKGAQPTLPGLDATNTETGTPPAAEAKTPKKTKGSRRPKADGAGADASDVADDADAEGDAAGPAAPTPPEPPKTGPAAPAAPPAAPPRTLDETVATMIERGNDTAFKITIALGAAAPGGPTINDVTAALQRLAASGNGEARAALLKGGEAVPPPPDAAVTEAKAATDAKAAHAASITPVASGPLTTRNMKPVVAQVVREAADGVLWRDATGAETRDLAEAYAAKAKMGMVPSLPILIKGTVESLVKNTVLVEHKASDGTVRLFHCETVPKKSDTSDAGDGKGHGKGKGGKGQKAA